MEEIVDSAVSGVLLTERELCTVRGTLRSATALCERLTEVAAAGRASSQRLGGIDKPLITQRGSRMCVGVNASHNYFVPDGVILNVSSSGATYFMEPREAVEMNNLDVRLSDSVRDEEIAILSLLPEK
ncbi:DNA mismatch repair protein MutS type 2 putative isoform 2 [Tripterygium wilfordii]|uniref:DNA mismatch repair protein MutS type 2 putative isoform 2 n=1 Tax=Tripterygium wilfordii TaxID=458696 RepID=A0A7J7C4P8_TRIWF|nr:DNA mismatch repair protein MutS type 2 putative isoform 2 [Tripterygium wilfordii]